MDCMLLNAVDMQKELIYQKQEYNEEMQTVIFLPFGKLTVFSVIKYGRGQLHSEYKILL